MAKNSHVKKVKMTSFSHFIRNATPAEKAKVYEQVLEGVARRQANSVSPAERVGPKCKTHPMAPHGFLRQASHANDRYVCECEAWDPYQEGYQKGWLEGFNKGYNDGQEDAT